MTAIADLVAHLLLAGLSQDALARAVDLAQQHANESADIRRPSADRPQTSDTQAERRRAADRERAKAKREAEKSAESADSPQTETQVIEKQEERKRPPDSGALTYLFPFSPADSQEKKEGVVGRAARGTRLPPDWRPTQADMNFAVCHISESRIAQEVEKFPDYWHARAGPGGVKLDWAAVWRTWIRKAAESGNGQRNGKPSPTMDAFDDLIARTGGAIEDDHPMCDITPRGRHLG